jgi:hypothetical protein
MFPKVAAVITMFLIFSGSSLALDRPACLTRSDSKKSVESLVAACQMNDHELLARLVFAEGLSTGFGDDPMVYEAIAWGVMNRVRLGEASQGMRRAYGRGISGVIFKKGQFNPAVSKKSPFAKAFLCPDNPRRWIMAKNAAGIAIAGSNNPFIQTPWEKRHGLSLVVNFYYPRSIQARGPEAPWEESKSLRFIGDLSVDGKVLSASRVRFYRLNQPPGDLIKK